jgi:hypothetical protein
VSGPEGADQPDLGLMKRMFVSPRRTSIAEVTSAFMKCSMFDIPSIRQTAIRLLEFSGVPNPGTPSLRWFLSGDGPEICYQTSEGELDQPIVE